MSGNDDSHTDLVDIHFLFHLNKVNRKQLLSCDLRVAFGKRWFAKRATLSPFFTFLGERVYDITFWKSELNNEINSMALETENLKVKMCGILMVFKAV